MKSTMMSNVYVVCMVTAFVLVADYVQGETYSFQTVTWADTRNGCLLANESTICDPGPTFCDVKDMISDTTLIDGNNNTWIDGFYYKSMWITNIGCVTLTDTELETLAVKHNLGATNDIEHCVASCGSTMPTIGLVNETCYCINATKAALRFIPTQLCNLPCPGNPSEFCGTAQSPIVPDFLTVYQREEQIPDSEEIEVNWNCRAINYTSTSDYQTVTRNCNEQLSFACKSLYASPVFYNFGNYTWEEARQYCQQLNYILTDTFVLSTQPESLEFNTLYWIGTFRVENYYWGYDLPMVRDDDPVPQCLSVSSLNGGYSVVRNQCNSSLPALCLSNTIETSTMSEQLTTDVNMTTVMETNSTDSSTDDMGYTTDSSNMTSTEVSSNYTMSSVSTSDMSTGTNTEMSSTVSSLPMTEDATVSSTKTTTKLTRSTVMITGSFSTPAGQADLLTSSAGMYIGVGVGAFVLLLGIPIITVIVLRRKQKIRQSVNKLEASVYDVTHRRSIRDRENIVNQLQDDQF